MSSKSKHPWWVIVMVVVAVIVLGPPLVGVAFGVVGALLGIAVLLLKVGLVALGVWALVMIFKGFFGSKRPTAMTLASTPDGTVVPEGTQDDQHWRADLDKELEEAIRKKNGSGT